MSNTYQELCAHVQAITTVNPPWSKISRTVHKQELGGLIAFCEEHRPQKAIVVSLDGAPRLLKIEENIDIHIMPYEAFLKALWGGQIIS